MTLQIYTYNINSAIPAQKVDVSRLEQEIRASSIITALEGTSVSNGVLYITFKAPLSAVDKTILDNDSDEPAGGLLGAHSGTPLPDQNYTSEGNPVISIDRSDFGAVRVAVVKPAGKETIYATHTYTDERSWYSMSKRVINESPTPIIDKNNEIHHFNLQFKRIINMKAGLVFDEEGIIEDQLIIAAQNNETGHGYSVDVFLDGVLQVEKPQFSDEQKQASWDYELDYHEGILTFANTDCTGRDVKISYSHVDPSEFTGNEGKNNRYGYPAEEPGRSAWVIQPLPGKALFVNKSEIQFTDDITFNQHLITEVAAISDYFTPPLGGGQGGTITAASGSSTFSLPAPAFNDQLLGMWITFSDMPNGNNNGSFQIESVAPDGMSLLFSNANGANDAGLDFSWKLSVFEPGSKIIIDRTVYKTLYQMIDEAVNADAGSKVSLVSPHVPDRGLKSDMNIFPFMYTRKKQLYSSLGMEMRIYLSRHEPFEGERATATFYMDSATDPGADLALERLGSE